jgi:AcrR family transcriptional regulator
LVFSLGPLCAASALWASGKGIGKAREKRSRVKNTFIDVDIDNIETNDNTVNMTLDAPLYHHGNLELAAIHEGLTMLADRDVDDISLREIARNVGVSATALYRHFPSKKALLNALANEGLEMLARAQISATDNAGGGAEGFKASGRAYVRFALANPTLFRLIMACGNAQRSTAMTFLLHNVAELAPRGLSPDKCHAHAMRAWAIVHGLATLMLDRMIQPDDPLIDNVISGDMI